MPPKSPPICASLPRWGALCAAAAASSLSTRMSTAEALNAPAALAAAAKPQDVMVVKARPAAGDNDQATPGVPNDDGKVVTLVAAMLRYGEHIIALSVLYPAKRGNHIEPPA
eukprot:13869045-Alexandrium_andersonii.AAC.1